MKRSPKNLQITFSGKRLTHFGGLYLLQKFFQKVNLLSLLSPFILLLRCLQGRILNNGQYTEVVVFALLFILQIPYPWTKLKSFEERYNVLWILSSLVILSVSFLHCFPQTHTSQPKAMSLFTFSLREFGLHRKI